ncbi:MAG: hypothetical protein CL587_09345 [Alteromonadaceae bacterium]|nr:hypothetical protein [Alteromonadaceae bacterium]
MNKVTSLLIVALTLTLAACASQPAYREASNGSFGYTETKLTDTQYRVYFKARGSDKTRAMDYAMLRAAEITLENQYDWFTVTERETLVDKETVSTGPETMFSQRYARVTECGALTCRTSWQPQTMVSTGVFIGGREQSEIESTLNIKMGKGTAPEDNETFNAEQVKTNLLMQLETE